MSLPIPQGRNRQGRRVLMNDVHGHRVTHPAVDATRHSDNHDHDDRREWRDALPVGPISKVAHNYNAGPYRRQQQNRKWRLK
jgi:hypothetical protein